MQLFSMGLYQLNLDGTQKLDSSGNPIQSYDNSDIQNFARAWTGFTRAPQRANLELMHWDGDNRIDPMQVRGEWCINFIAYNDNEFSMVTYQQKLVLTILSCSTHSSSQVNTVIHFQRRIFMGVSLEIRSLSALIFLPRSIFSKREQHTVYLVPPFCLTYTSTANT